MKPLHFSLILLFGCVLLSFFNSMSCQNNEEKVKKKKKKKSKNLLENGLPIPDAVRPTSVSRELFCDSCIAILTEAMKVLRKSRKESDVLAYVEDNLCDGRKYNIYHFPPPDMKGGCEAFFGAYNDEIPNALMSRKPDATTEDVIQYLCYNRTQVCVGVDWNNINRMMDDSIMIDGEPVKIDTLNQKAAEDKEEKNDL